MNPVRIIEGAPIPFGRANVDTDLIIPARHLKVVSREGLGRFAFEALQGAGGPLDDPALAAAPILVAGENFGCGSSREHAVWALLDRGILAVIAPSFSDIFAGNAFKNGLVTVALPAATVAWVLTSPVPTMRIDLEDMTVTAGNIRVDFALDPFRRKCLLEGLDEIGLTLHHAAQINAYEADPTVAFLRRLRQAA